MFERRFFQWFSLHTIFPFLKFVSMPLFAFAFSIFAKFLIQNMKDEELQFQMMLIYSTFFKYYTSKRKVQASHLKIMTLVIWLQHAFSERGSDVHFESDL